jgi:hypothetical protein
MEPARTFLNPPPVADLLAELAAFRDLVAATPAGSVAWARRLPPPEWSLNEVACHLRDVEREVHQARLHAILEEDGAFVPGVDADLWAEERDYWSQDGRAALAEFLRLRDATIDLLAPLPLEIWDRRGQHTFFGPTTLHELVYLAVQHDRIHARQLAELSTG